MSFTDNAWDEYRGWASRSRKKKRELKVYSYISLISTIVAVVSGAVAATWAGSEFGKAFAIIAAIAAAITGLVGSRLMTPKLEKQWILSRALAESIKSECYLANASVAPYTSDHAHSLSILNSWLKEETAVMVEHGVNQAHDRLEGREDKRRPDENMTIEWYLKQRLTDQIEFFEKRQRANERKASQLRWLAVGMAALAAIAGVLGVSAEGDGANGNWVAALIAIGSAFAAFGLLDRTSFLAVHYGSLAVALGRIIAWSKTASPSLPELVARTERVLQSESTFWSTTLISESTSRESDTRES